MDSDIPLALVLLLEMLAFESIVPAVGSPSGG
jgi:hypothetical protein